MDMMRLEQELVDALNQDIKAFAEMYARYTELTNSKDRLPRTVERTAEVAMTRVDASALYFTVSYIVSTAKRHTRAVKDPKRNGNLRVVTGDVAEVEELAKKLSDYDNPIYVPSFMEFFNKYSDYKSN